MKTCNRIILICVLFATLFNGAVLKCIHDEIQPKMVNTQTVKYNSNHNVVKRGTRHHGRPAPDYGQDGFYPIRLKVDYRDLGMELTPSDQDKLKRIMGKATGKIEQIFKGLYLLGVRCNCTVGSHVWYEVTVLKNKTKKQNKNVYFKDFCIVYLTCHLKVKGLLGQGQRSHGSRSNAYVPRPTKGSKQRQMGSHQRQVASLSLSLCMLSGLIYVRISFCL